MERHGYGIRSTVPSGPYGTVTVRTPKGCAMSASYGGVTAIGSNKLKLLVTRHVPEGLL